MPSTVGGPLGIQPENWDLLVINRSGDRILGDLVALDINAADADVSNFVIGDDNAITANAVLPVTAVLDHGIFGVVIGGTLTDNGRMRIRIEGFVEANVVGTNAAALVDKLVATNAADTLNSDGAAGSKIVAKPLETSAGASAELIWVWIRGYHGWGTD